MIKQTAKIFSILLLCQALAFGQGNITVESAVDRDHILIGDVIEYAVSVTHDPDVELQMPALAQNLGMFEVRDYKTLDPEKVESQIVERNTYSISTFDTGDFVIPELEIQYRVTGDSSWQVIKTEPINIVVASLNPDEAGDIRDIKPPITPPRDYRLLILYIAIGLLVVAAIAFLIYYLKRRREGKSLLPKRSKPLRPAHEIAFEALAALQASDLLARGEVKEYYTRLSDVVRQYIENRYYIPAMEKTTTELLVSLAEQNLNSYVESMRTLLSRSDLVKFAKFIPSEQEHADSWQLAWQFVENTKLVFVEAEEAHVETTPGEENSATEKAEPVAAAIAAEKVGEDKNV